MTEQQLKPDGEVELQPILELHATTSSSGGSSKAERWSTALHNWSRSAVVRAAARNLGLIALW